MKYLIIIFLSLTGCMTVEERRLTDLIAVAREGGIPDVQNQCTVFADKLLTILQSEGVEAEKVIVSTNGAYWNHAMVKSGDWYMDNNSWFPCKTGDGMFDCFHFYKFQGEEGTDGIKYNN